MCVYGGASPPALLWDPGPFFFLWFSPFYQGGKRFFLWQSVRGSLASGSPWRWVSVGQPLKGHLSKMEEEGRGRMSFRVKRISPAKLSFYPWAKFASYIFFTAVLPCWASENSWQCCHFLFRKLSRPKLTFLTTPFIRLCFFSSYLRNAQEVTWVISQFQSTAPRGSHESH